jgi:tRNA pseudouridine38-40 synthase
VGRNLKITLAYDGSEFHGWQVQPGLPTVQGTLADCLKRLTGEDVLPQGSGRTDAGVHALAQVASVQLESPIPEGNLVIALNDMLPASVRINSVEVVPEGFHARHSAKAKTYRYRIYRGDVCPPFLARYVYHDPYPMDEDAVIRAADQVVGKHDFTSFAASDPDRSARIAEAAEEEKEKAGARFRHPETGGEAAAIKETGAPFWPSSGQGGAADDDDPSHSGKPTNVRTIHSSLWARTREELIYTVRGDGFLHHMVRNLVGTFLLVGKGSLQASDVPTILEARNRSAAGPTAAACGLYLVSVEY